MDGPACMNQCMVTPCTFRAAIPVGASVRMFRLGWRLRQCLMSVLFPAPALPVRNTVLRGSSNALSASAS